MLCLYPIHLSSPLHSQVQYLIVAIKRRIDILLLPVTFYQSWYLRQFTYVRHDTSKRCQDADLVVFQEAAS